MSKPYTTQTISGYNSSPPADDGSQVATNEIKWSNHKTKLGDPVKALSEDINTELLNAFGLIFGQDISSHASAYTVILSDQGKFLDVTGTTTITLLPAATAGASFALAIINNGSGVVTVDGDGAETINGSATITLYSDEALIITCSGALWIGPKIITGFKPVLTLSDATNISWDLLNNDVAKVTLGGNRTLDNPTNMVDGAAYVVRVTQDGTGSRTLAYGSAYIWPNGITPVLSTTAAAIDIITFTSDGTNMYGVISQDFS